MMHRFVVEIIVFCSMFLCCDFVDAQGKARGRKPDLSTDVVHLQPSTEEGRIFDGIGGLSGGGATSKLLVNYPEPQKSQILDYLFKPQFGASLQILKVEIGGDGESSDGSESAHMHNEWDENYHRGYEWWLMREAKRRNPDIKLYGLAWSFPGWVGGGTQSPWTYPKRSAEFIGKFVVGARQHHNLTIDYVGVWNERDYSVKYILALRAFLDANGFSATQIIAADNKWEVADSLDKFVGLRNAVAILGAHYPGTFASSAALKSGKPLWSSEDYSTFNDETGAGCWARILNQNYVNGYMTSTLSWNLIASYYDALPWTRDGLMTAIEPWSGHYDVQDPIWVTAHTTQFVDVGWRYFPHGRGVGHLPKNGSYVTLMSPDSKYFTLIIETMSHDHSICVRPRLPPYDVEPQNVTFSLGEFLKDVEQLNVWKTQLTFGKEKGEKFVELKPLRVVGGHFTVALGIDQIWTVTNQHRGMKGRYPTPPKSREFPLPYMDDYEAYAEHSEAYNFVQQVGSFEVHSRNENKVNRQMTLQRPVEWCSVRSPLLLGGNFNWSDVTVSVHFLFSAVNGTDGIFVVSRLDRGGCDQDSSRGIFLFVTLDRWMLTADFNCSQVIKQGYLSLSREHFYRVTLKVERNDVEAYLDQVQLLRETIAMPSSKGFVGYGTTSFGAADFDNFVID